MKIKRDDMVLLVQRWLNLTYSTKPGYKIVEETGQTGWSTMESLTRALQIELKIDSPNGNFGPATTSAFGELSINSNPTESTPEEEALSIQRKIYILQGALFCKGYNPTGFTGNFGTGTENAIKELQADAGLSKKDGVVTPIIMKSLLTMDAFKLLDYPPYKGKAIIREIQQQLNKTYSSNPHFSSALGLIPYDGIYGRSMNKALIYALQIEEGIKEPNGHFGPATLGNCPTLMYGHENNFVKLLQYCLYCNGKNPNGYTGYFGDGTKAAVKDFQAFTCLDADGIAGKQTWQSLLLSTGDPKRKGTACDCATTITDKKAQTLKNNGYKAVGRYLTGIYELTPNECKTIINNSLKLFPIFEVGGYELKYFNKSQGTTDAIASNKAAKNLGFPDNTIIYFAVDFDAMDHDITNNIIPYFEGIHEWFKENSTYRIGIYAPRNVCTRVASNGYSCSSFVCDMSTGFSGNLGFALPDDWAIDQISTIGLGSGDNFIEIDNNIARYDVGVSKLDLIPEDTVSLITSADKSALDYFNIWGPSYDLKDRNVAVLDLLRYYKYAGFSWLITIGPATKGYIDYFKATNTNIYNKLFPYIQANNTVTSYINNNRVDLPHLAASTLGYISSPVVPDFWTGWGGDLATAMADVTKLCLKDGVVDDTKADSMAELVIGNKSYSCSRIDIESDIDAIYIAKNITSKSLGDLIESYFNTINSNLRRSILYASLGISGNPTLEELNNKIYGLMIGKLGFGMFLEGLALKDKATYKDKATSKSFPPSTQVIKSTVLEFSKYILKEL